MLSEERRDVTQCEALCLLAGASGSTGETGASGQAGLTGGFRPSPSIQMYAGMAYYQRRGGM